MDASSPEPRLDVRAYLDRIAYRGPQTPTAEALRALHLAHMLAVPFENLDIGIGREIVCDESRILYKVIQERRGGFCYELNGAFAALLRALGFDVTLLSARVARADGSESPEFDHLILRVDLEEPWLADVGFGDSFVEPLRLEPDIEHPQFGTAYRLKRSATDWIFESKTGDAWQKQYSFTLQPRQLSEFAEMCRYHQTSPKSTFTQKSVCSLATREGRITIAGPKLIQTRQGVREERDLTEDERVRCLKEAFGVVLPPASR
jgi:N-hydroxyarylamine O-acetyltransferase